MASVEQGNRLIEQSVQEWDRVSRGETWEGCAGRVWSGSSGQEWDSRGRNWNSSSKTDSLMIASSGGA